MRISDWSSDVCSSDLLERQATKAIVERKLLADEARNRKLHESPAYLLQKRRTDELLLVQMLRDQIAASVPKPSRRSEEHTSELQSLMRISYAVFCLKKKIRNNNKHNNDNSHIHTLTRT